MVDTEVGKRTYANVSEMTGTGDSFKNIKLRSYSNEVSLYPIFAGETILLLLGKLCIRYWINNAEPYLSSDTNYTASRHDCLTHEEQLS